MMQDKKQNIDQTPQDESTEEYSFLKETIKFHKSRKRHILWRMIRFVILGLLFGVLMSFSFYMMRPFMERIFTTAEDPPRITFPDLTEDTTPTPPDTSETNPPPSTDETTEPDGDDTIDGEIVVEIPPLTSQQYQELLQSLFADMQELNHSIVMIHAVDPDTILVYDNEITTGASTAVIVYETEDEILLLADNSLLSGNNEWSATFVDRQAYPVTIKMEDANRGLVIFRVDRDLLTESTRESMRVATMGNSQLMGRGDFVMALGNIHGMGNGVAYGILSSREFLISFADSRHTILTTDIPASSQGNGALFNRRGELIGLILPRLNIGNNTNTANAIAITGLRNVITLLSNGEPIPFVGVQGMAITENVSELSGLPIGMFISSILTDSPAMDAGLQNGDIITSFNGITILNTNMFQHELLQQNVGDSIRIEAKRRGNDGYVPIEFDVVLGVFR